MLNLPVSEQSFTSFLQNLDFDFEDQFLDEVGLDDIAWDYPYPFDWQQYRKLEFYYVS